MAWRTTRCSGLARLSCRPRNFCRPFHLDLSNPTIGDILALPSRESPESITAVGWVRTIRKQKRFTFLELGDGSTAHTLQALLTPSQSDGLNTGTAVAIRGLWQASPESSEQANELHAADIQIYGPCAEDFPIQKKYHSPEYLRTIPHLRLRTSQNAALARLRSELDYSFSTFFRQRGFVRVQPPTITSSDCEGAGEVFKVSSSGSQQDARGKTEAHQAGEFFKEPKFLTVSSQLHLEAFVHEHPKVWALSPTFRAEKSDTPRHVSEFMMLEVELRTSSLDDLLDLAENMIREVILSLDASKFVDELSFSRQKGIQHDSAVSGSNLRLRWDSLSSKHWPRITYEQALELIAQAQASQEAPFLQVPPHNGLQLEHERWLVDKVGQGQPLFVTHYPRSIKPFYMLPSAGMDDLNTDHGTVSCFDLLLPEVCEVVGGSLREHRLEPLLGAMRASGMATTSSMPEKPLDWYVDLRRFGSVPHGGFGLGLDRLLCYLSGVSNIKDIVQWPRYHGRCEG